MCHYYKYDTIIVRAKKVMVAHHHMNYVLFFQSDFIKTNNIYGKYLKTEEEEKLK